MIKVYHAVTMDHFASNEDFQATASRYKDPLMFRHVANVDTSDLDRAFWLTNTVQNYWGNNKGVQEIAQHNRSSSIGDVFVQDDDKVFVILPVGFAQVDARRFWMGDIPSSCQYCDTPIGDKFIDGAIRNGGWGYLCPSCHKAHGVGLGTGKGQEYTKQEDGRFLKTEG